MFSALCAVVVVFDAADLDAEDFEAVVSEDDFEGAEEDGADDGLGALVSAFLPPMVSLRPGWISAGSAPTASRLSA